MTDLANLEAWFVPPSTTKPTQSRSRRRPAETPSWCLWKVHVKMMFDYVGGIWLQTAMAAIADGRACGNQTAVATTHPAVRVHSRRCPGSL